ncbi:MAG: DnaA regulatory inactivator Hda [Halieaceae bacterium]|nr:DnaA regulatory inactivator Hda [Halieaceae bacterium]MCP4842471.1 DnaA regulatory inactivator Hda [Halieaceae bacterium]
MAELGHGTGAKTGQKQLPLKVQLRDDATVDNFLALSDSQTLVDALQCQSGEGGEPIIYLYGPPGSGKSHLLQAACHLDGTGTLYLPLPDLVQYPPGEVLQGAECLDRICIDDIDAVLGIAAWERALFNLINAARERGCRLVLSGLAAPRALPVALEDLRSRLSWGIVYRLHEGDDTEKAMILQFRADRRGIALPQGVANYIVSRAPRAMDALLEVLDRLDENSLVHKRPLSIPFVRETMGW